MTLVCFANGLHIVNKTYKKNSILVFFRFVAVGGFFSPPFLKINKKKLKILGLLLKFIMKKDNNFFKLITALCD